MDKKLYIVKIFHGKGLIKIIVTAISDERAIVRGTRIARIIHKKEIGDVKFGSVKEITDES